MPTSPKASDLKKRLVAEGFEIFRVQGDRVVLAERVRDNLIMDSGVAVVARNPFAVRLVVRAQLSQFPKESEPQLLDRARALAAPALNRGYVEAERNVVPVPDPGGGSGHLDTWYEVAYEKPVSSEELFQELRYALELEKTAGTG